MQTETVNKVYHLLSKEAGLKTGDVKLIVYKFGWMGEEIKVAEFDNLDRGTAFLISTLLNCHTKDYSCSYILD